MEAAKNKFPTVLLEENKKHKILITSCEMNNLKNEIDLIDKLTEKLNLLMSEERLR